MCWFICWVLFQKALRQEIVCVLVSPGVWCKLVCVGLSRWFCSVRGNVQSGRKLDASEETLERRVRLHCKGSGHGESPFKQTHTCRQCRSSLEEYISVGGSRSCQFRLAPRAGTMSVKVLASEESFCIFCLSRVVLKGLFRENIHCQTLICKFVGLKPCLLP